MCGKFVLSDREVIFLTDDLRLMQHQDCVILFLLHMYSNVAIVAIYSHNVMYWGLLNEQELLKERGALACA